MIDKEVVRAKLSEIDQYAAEVTPILDLPEQEILGELKNVRTLERNFQLIVDAILSINSHLITSLSITPSEDYQGTFIILAQHQVLPTEFSQRIAPVVGLRNQIVHAYEKIDRQKFIKEFKEDHYQFRHYIELINRFINQSQ